MPHSEEYILENNILPNQNKDFINKKSQLHCNWDFFYKVN